MHLPLLLQLGRRRLPRHPAGRPPARRFAPAALRRATRRGAARGRRAGPRPPGRPGPPARPTRPPARPPAHAVATPPPRRQAFLTFLGNTTVAIAACLIALSNGWTPNDLIPTNPFAEAPPADESAEAEAAAPPALAAVDMQPAPLLAAELAAATVVASYLMKYIEPALGVPFEPSAIVGWALVLGIPALVGYRFVSTAPTKAA